MMGVAVVPTTSFAQDSGAVNSCDCFCHSDEGAVEAPGVSSGYESCRLACESIDERVLGCYDESLEANRPENNQICWRKEDCLSDEVPTEVDPSGAILAAEPSVWGGQESFCPSNQGYCYNPPGAVDEYGGKTTVNLGVPIGDLEEVGDIGTYVEAIYTYLISAAALLAIFMIMIGGVQYMVAGGNTTATGKAKERISSALLGLVLIMSAYVIARVIDPRLVDFNFFAVPKIQTIIFLDSGSSCEKLIDLGVDIGPPSEDACPGEDCSSRTECGYKGGIVGLENVGDGSSVTLEVGDNCNYSLCPDPTESCTADSASATGFSCIKCSEIYDASSDTDLEPNESVCGNALSPGAVAEAAEESASGGSSSGSRAACLYHNAGAGDQYANDSCIVLSYPENEGFLNCDLLREAARIGGGESCRMYDLVIGQSDHQSILYDTTAELDWLQENDNSFSLFTSLCVEDPCGVGYPEKGCAPYVADRTGGLCSTYPFTESSACQQAADLAFTANCYDQNYINDWNRILDIWDREGALGSYEMGVIYSDLYPSTEDGEKIDDPWW